MELFGLFWGYCTMEIRLECRLHHTTVTGSIIWKSDEALIKSLPNRLTPASGKSTQGGSMNAVISTLQTLKTTRVHEQNLKAACNQAACNQTLFWLFWSRYWQLSSHRYQLRWWRSPFYWWSNEMGLRFSKFWGISSRYGSPHKLA